MTECYKLIIDKVADDVKIKDISFKVKRRKLKVQSNKLLNECNFDDIEIKLLNIWKDTLGICNITEHDDFFELGGNSLKSMLLVNKVKKEFGNDIAASSVFLYPTVHKMACYLGTYAKNNNFKSLVKISEKDTNKKIFCIHPAPGSVFCYLILKKYIDPDWSIYALQAQGLNKSEKALKTIEEMAVEYIKEIKSVEHDGPYVLLGWSIGGKIAYEIARQLQNSGDKVEYLFLLDTDPVFYRKHKIAFSMYPYALYSLINHGRTIWQNMNITSFNIFSLLRRLRMWFYLIKSAYIYEPEKLYENTEVILLQTKEGERREKKIKLKQSSITSFVPNLNKIPIRGSHMEMLSEPDVIENSEIINSFLRED